LTGKQRPAHDERNRLNPRARAHEQAKRSMSAADNDAALVLLEKIAARDATAMEAFYRQYARQVYAFALRQLGRPSDAEDAVIDTYPGLLRLRDRHGRGRADAEHPRRRAEKRASQALRNRQGSRRARQ
jgi:DNA-directed RNA polymerase specialized sigma24 family protein